MKKTAKKAPAPKQPDHSHLGPSSAKRWMSCPGSVALSLGLKDDKSEFAAEGTVAHSLAELAATDKADELDLLGRVGKIVKEDGFEIEITDEMVDAALDFARVIREDTLAMQKKKVKNPPMIDRVEGKAEVRVCASSVDKQLYGTADYLLYRKGHALKVYDFKYGKGVVVEATENPQLAIYAVAAMDTIAGWDFPEVELVIFQPRAPHVDGRERRWTASMPWLREFQALLKMSVEATDQKDAPLVAGDWCRWCRARATCPAMSKAVQTQAAVDFATTPAPEPKMTTGLPEVRTLPVERLAQALAWEDAINSWYESVKAVIREKLEAGETVPGYKLVEGKTNRAWVSEEEVVATYGKDLGDGLYTKKILSPAALEKKVGKGNLKDGLTYKPEGKKAIAPDRDPRPEAKRSAVEDFAPVGAKKVETAATTTAGSLAAEILG